jgi:hypothetical protein
MTFDVWYHGLIGFCVGWFLAGAYFFAWSGMRYKLALAFVCWKNRCTYCNRRIAVCMKNECEGVQSRRKQWQAQARQRIMPQIGFLGQMLIDVSNAAQQTDTPLQTPNLDGPLTPPNG